MFASRTEERSQKTNTPHPIRPSRNRADTIKIPGTGTVQPVYAALDLGTNNCRLLVARPSRRGFLVIDAFSRIIRLGEGVSRSGELSDRAMTRTIEALRVCADKMRRKDVQRSRLIATEACRVARNAEHFIDRVQEETGLSLEVVSRETEAKLAVSGCAISDRPQMRLGVGVRYWGRVVGTDLARSLQSEIPETTTPYNTALRRKTTLLAGPRYR